MMHSPVFRLTPKATAAVVALAVFLACGALYPVDVHAAPNVGEDRPEARQRVRPDPLPSEPRRQPPRRRVPDTEEEADEPQGPSGCPDRGQPLELIV